PNRGLAAYPASLLRDASARRRGRPARRAGTARPREPRHDPDLHARLADPPAGGVSERPPARPADRRRAGGPSVHDRGTSDGRIAGAGEESGLLDSAADAEAAAVARLREAEAAGRTGGQGRALARAGLVVTSAFLLSRVLGWVRVVVIGTTFGATA